MSTKVIYFSGIYYHTKFQDSTVSDTVVMMFIPSFMKISPLVQKLLGGNRHMDKMKTESYFSL